MMFISVSQSFKLMKLSLKIMIVIELEGKSYSLLIFMPVAIVMEVFLVKPNLISEGVLVAFKKD
jgi:hypothetical protein